jgi:hypothetical protein
MDTLTSSKYRGALARTGLFLRCAGIPLLELASGYALEGMALLPGKRSIKRQHIRAFTRLAYGYRRAIERLCSGSTNLHLHLSGTAEHHRGSAVEL